MNIHQGKLVKITVTADKCHTASVVDAGSHYHAGSFFHHAFISSAQRCAARHKPSAQGICQFGNTMDSNEIAGPCSRRSLALGRQSGGF